MKAKLLVGSLLILVAMSAQAKTSIQKNMMTRLDYPNDKDLVVRQIKENDKTKTAYLYSIQAVDEEGKRFSIQDDYHERVMICTSFGYGSPSKLFQPIASKEQGDQVLKLGDDGETLKSMEMGLRVSALEMLPCQVKN